MVVIEYNDKRFWKQYRYVVKIYVNWILQETHPYNDLSEIHLQGFTLKEMVSWHTKN